MHPNPLARPRFGGTPLGRRPRLLPRRSLPRHRARIRHHGLRRTPLIHGLRGAARVSPRVLVALLPAFFRLPVDLAVLAGIDVVAPIDRSRRVAGGRSGDVTHTLGKAVVDVVLNLHGTDVSCRWVEPDDRT